VGATEDKSDQRWDPWPKVALYVVILVLAGAVVLSAWGGDSLLEAIVFMCVMLAGILALNVWWRRN
jgi:hypothetical protein